MTFEELSKIEYHKINGLYKRFVKIENIPLPEGKRWNEFDETRFACPEFEYLFDNDWIWTEKLDGTNMRLIVGTDKVGIGGKSADSQIPAKLTNWMTTFYEARELKLKSMFSGGAILFGEGVGRGIQKGGENYGEEQHFKLFDVYIDGFWLNKEAVADIAKELDLDVAPVLFVGPISEAIARVKEKQDSTFGKFTFEGFVGQPNVRLLNAKGQRICTKIKVKDFYK